MLRFMGTCETLWANHPSSGLKPVTETNTAVIPPPDSPSRLEGEITSTPYIFVMLHVIRMILIWCDESATVAKQTQAKQGAESLLYKV